MLLYIYHFIYFSSSSSRDSETHPTFFSRQIELDGLRCWKGQERIQKKWKPKWIAVTQAMILRLMSQFLMPLAFNKKTHTKCIKDVRNYQPSIWATSPATKKKQGRQRDSVTPASHLQPMASLRPNVLPL